MPSSFIEVLHLADILRSSKPIAESIKLLSDSRDRSTHFKPEHSFTASNIIFLSERILRLANSRLSFFLCIAVFTTFSWSRNLLLACLNSLLVPEYRIAFKTTFVLSLSSLLVHLRTGALNGSAARTISLSSRSSLWRKRKKLF